METIFFFGEFTEFLLVGQVEPKCWDFFFLMASLEFTAQSPDFYNDPFFCSFHFKKKGNLLKNGSRDPSGVARGGGGGGSSWIFMRLAPAGTEKKKRRSRFFFHFFLFYFWNEIEKGTGWHRVHPNRWYLTPPGVLMSDDLFFSFFFGFRRFKENIFKVVVQKCAQKLGKTR